MKLAWLGVWFAAIALAVIAFPFGLSVPMESQLAVYESLVTISSFVFGVMGAWLALVYPEALKKIVDPAVQAKGEVLKTVRRLLIPMGIALGVIGIAMAVRLLTLVAKFNPQFHSHRGFLREVSFSTATFLSCLVLISLLYAIAPGLTIQDAFRGQVDKQERINRMKSR